MKKIIIFLFALGSYKTLHAQFTQLELFTGFDKTDFTFYSSQVLHQNNKLSLATLAFFQKFSEKEHTALNESGVQPTLFLNVTKHFSLGPSLYYNSIAGYSKRISVKYTLHNSRLLVVINPSVGYAQTNKPEAVYAETFAQFQYNLPINSSISLCINGQFLTVWNSFKTHARSFQQWRTGVLIKGHQIGFGLDLDKYGPSPNVKSSYGLYYRKSLLTI